MSKDTFITDTFLLGNKYAEQLYFDYAEKQPIIDYHNHLIPKSISENEVFGNISQVWIAGDHYKWRAMRTMGVDEKYITGNASDEEKFHAWAKTVPHTLRNPLYHWTHLELKRYFGIDQYLNEESSKEIYAETAAKLQQPTYATRGLLEMMQVETLCTTEDPIDTLEHHKALAKDNWKVKVSTAFRPDKSILIESEGYLDYLQMLSEASGINIESYQDLCDALLKRMEYFHENGCRLCDHGLSRMYYTEFTDAEVSTLFSKRLKGEVLSPLEEEKFKTALLLFLSENYHRLGWVQQFHLGALRNNNTRMLGILGMDTGWDSVGDFPQAQTLSAYLDHLDSSDKLTKTIIYNLNPSDNEVFATMVGNFNDGSVKGKVQWGSSWWFLDQKDGITKQLDTLSNMGVLSCFIGMLTDSRSFLSFPRHEYFRRILCNLLGQEIASGELPNDMDLVGNMVANISYGNAKDYFNF
ncbi:glucuronate isomerase [Flagellimonas taeanensis]|uniref:glucuronate isomerase n=1 Tax=Flavobacteriaceae TaxID=49546 RepID=UPI000E697298|nr:MULTISPECIES: glucuronate isomerase [Allomuricauda]MDC6387036.1 glucuronate isomerase [Muricauda sp. SK9]RIV50460.1 glucuronate isomerase [Allomuricauda taeanensis]